MSGFVSNRERYMRDGPIAHEIAGLTAKARVLIGQIDAKDYDGTWLHSPRVRRNLQIQATAFVEARDLLEVAQARLTMPRERAASDEID